jgi:glycosyltransferase involved in cell wall biosynthesis
VLVSNDLDTLLPNYLISKLKSTNLVYDSHELFCEVPELIANPAKKKLWKRLERWIFPKLKDVFTVNESIAKIYGDEYKMNLKVVRNIPSLGYQAKIPQLSKSDLGLPLEKKIIVLQGAGINMDRGAEEAVEAMQYVNDALLLIIGSGDVMNILKQMVIDFKLDDKVKFIGKVPFEKLLQYTQHADLGLTLDKDTNINYRYSLPNKLFDYIHAGVPVLASDLLEIRKIVFQYSVGDCIDNHNPQHIADKINCILNDKVTLQMWKKNTKIAAANLNWENEEQQLIAVYKQFL